MMLIFITFLVLVSYSSNDETCDNIYDSCTGLSVSEPIGKWLFDGYNKLFNRNPCLDVFEICKKNQPVG